MASKTSKKNKKQVSEVNETTFIKKFLIILSVVVAMVLALYFVTKAMVDNRNNFNDDVPVAGKINYNIISVGTLLNRPYDDYYVMVYNSEDSDAIYYSAFITKYQQIKDAKKIYFCDLSNPVNSTFVAEDGKSNPKATKIEDLKFGNVTLLYVKNGKINKYIEDINQIKTHLQ